LIFNGIGKLVIFFITVISALMLQACASGKALRTDVVPHGDIPGTYILILYGGNYGGDLETIAFLDKEGDSYTFEPYAPDFVFRATKGLAADKAIREATEFIRLHPEVNGEQFLSIKDEKGEIIGYELRPLYLPITFGTDDVIDVYYRLKEDRVLVFVRLKPSIEKRNEYFDLNQR